MVTLHTNRTTRKAGVFSYDPKTEAVQQTISLSGNLNYIHFFE